jgi:hypothetical protein
MSGEPRINHAHEARPLRAATDKSIHVAGLRSGDLASQNVGLYTSKTNN